MTPNQVKDIRDWFNQYVASFQSDDRHVQINYDLKHSHSLRVVDNMDILTQPDGFSQHEKLLAHIIALLHDIGRFEQFRQYQTYADAKSVNHAEHGLLVLEQEKVLTQLTMVEGEIITKSIRYHNRPALPKDERDEVLQYAKWIRDADKLDIWKLVIDYYTNPKGEENQAMGFNLPGGPEISDHIWQTIMNGETVNYRDLRYQNDMHLTMAAWVFDLNTTRAIQLAVERNYIPSIQKLLPHNNKANAVFDKIYRYIQEKSGTVSVP